MDLKHEIEAIVSILIVGYVVYKFISTDAGTCRVMRAWQDFLDTLNTDGGHILLLAIMVWLGMIGMKYAVPKSDDLYVGAFTALLILLKSAGSNKTRRDRPSPADPTTPIKEEASQP